MFPLNHKILIPHADSVSFRSAAMALAASLKRLNITKLLVGVSGGADSVLTLRLLTEVARSHFPLSIGICHVNFQLRGEESFRDEDFVKLLSMEIQEIIPGVNTYFRRFDTMKYAEERHISIEMAARDLRHNLWNDLIAHEGYQRIATGHTADDNEETLLLNLLRGSGPTGLRGMAAIGDRILRPLLYLNKKRILYMLKEATEIQNNYLNHPSRLTNKYPKGYVTDSTNTEASYQRNYLRNVVIPSVEKKWEGASAALQTSIALQAEAADLLDFTLSQKLSSLKNLDELPGKTVREFPAPVSLVFKWLGEYGISSNQARDIAEHIMSYDSKNPGKGVRWLLENNAEVVFSNDTLKLRNPNSSDANLLYILTPPSEKNWEELHISDFSVIKNASPAHDVYLPLSPDNYIWRNPQKGDRIKIGKNGSKLVSDVLKEGKIPLSFRSKILILVNRLTGNIIWIPGLRRSTRDDLCSPSSPTAWHLSLGVWL